MMQLTMIVDQTPIIAESNRAIMQEEDEFYGMIHQARDQFRLHSASSAPSTPTNGSH